MVHLIILPLELNNLIGINLIISLKLTTQNPTFNGLQVDCGLVIWKAN